MSVDFNAARWAKIKHDYGEWWAGRLKRPLIHIALTGAPPDRPEPPLPSHAFTSFYDDTVSPKAIVDRWDYDLACRRYVGDAFPQVWPNFGPGVVAAFQGARLENGHDTVWFHPERDGTVDELEFHFDPNARWCRHIEAIYRAGLERWQGLVQMGMTDLGGNLDILSSFRPSEKLLLDLYDHPEAVKRKTWDAHAMWWHYYEHYNRLLRPVNPGYSAWTPLYSETPYYMLQCDFCYMIGPAMFDEFVKPELQASCRRLSNAFYHLDGPGELPHLDSLLTIPALKGVQWIPGAGQPDCRHWPQVYRKIRDAGKLIQLFGGINVLDTVAAQLGSAEGICLIGWESYARQDDVRAALRRYGVE